MATAASDKKGHRIITVDMRKMSSVCDYFVIAGGTSTTHIRAIADNMIKEMKAKGEKLWHVEGEREAAWILIDFGDVVGHVFLNETRKFYDLERLWRDAPQARFAEPGQRSASSKRKKSARVVAKRSKVKKAAKKTMKRTVKKAAKKSSAKKSRKKSK